jgi:predicted MPP superfamily phosphohydrolase
LSESAIAAPNGLQSLTCPHKIAVLGNHEVLVRVAEVTDVLKLHGVRVLSNSNFLFDAMEVASGWLVQLYLNRGIGTIACGSLQSRPEFLFHRGSTL